MANNLEPYSRFTISVSIVETPFTVVKDGHDKWGNSTGERYAASEAFTVVQYTSSHETIVAAIEHVSTLLDNTSETFGGKEAPRFDG